MKYFSNCNCSNIIKILFVAHRKAAIELNRKSQMVSEAVEEVLSLVDKATETFKEIAGDDVVTLFDGKSCNCYAAQLDSMYANLSSIATPKGDQSASGGRKAEEGGAVGASAANTSGGATSGGGAGGQQQDWSILWSCFENPLTLLSTTDSLPKGMQVDGEIT